MWDTRTFKKDLLCSWKQISILLPNPPNLDKAENSSGKNFQSPTFRLTIEYLSALERCHIGNIITCGIFRVVDRP